MHTRSRHWGTAELLESARVEVVLSLLRNGRCSAARASATSSAAAPPVTNQNHNISTSGKQQQMVHEPSCTRVLFQSIRKSCHLPRGCVAEKVPDPRVVIADGRTSNKNCYSYMPCSPSFSLANAPQSTPPILSARTFPSTSSPPTRSAGLVSSIPSSQSSTFQSLHWTASPLVLRDSEVHDDLGKPGGIQGRCSSHYCSSARSWLHLLLVSDRAAGFTEGRDATSIAVLSSKPRHIEPSIRLVARPVVRACAGNADEGDHRRLPLIHRCRCRSSFSSIDSYWMPQRRGSFALVLPKTLSRGLHLQCCSMPQHPWQQQQRDKQHLWQPQQHPWERHPWGNQHQQRRWYTPPSRRNWAKQHGKIFTRRPLTDNFSLGRLHPELEWFRERASQPVSLFMGFPDLAKLHVRGGASYINEMDASTLSIVLAAIASQGRTSATSPHLLQHNSPLIEQMGTRAAALAPTAPDPTLAYLFRGCAAAGVSDWATVCTLVGYIDTRLPRFSVHDVLVVMQGIQLARTGSVGHFVDEADGVRAPLSPVYVHRPFVDRVVGQLELLLQYREDVLPVELCASATLVAGLGYATGARLQFVSGLLAHVPQQQLALTPPRALAAAMEVFARHRSELNVDSSDFAQKDHRALPPLLRAAAAPPGLEPSRTQLTLIFLVAPLLHRLQTRAGARGASAERRGRGGSRSCRAGSASPATAAGGVPTAAALRALSEAAATAAAAAVEERSEVRRRGSLLRHAVGICLTWAYEQVEHLSVHHVSKVLYAATAARLYPSGPLMGNLVKTSLEQLDACTPADLSRLLYAILHIGGRRRYVDPVLVQEQSYAVHTLHVDVEMPDFNATSQERVQQALKVCLEACSSSTLALVYSVLTKKIHETTSTPASLSREGAPPPSLSLFPSSSERINKMALLAKETARCFTPRLTRARPEDLVTFLVARRTVEMEDDDPMAAKMFEILIPCLQALDPAQMASLLAVVTEEPLQQHGSRRKDFIGRLVASLKMSLTEHRQPWQPETCLRTLISLSRLVSPSFAKRNGNTEQGSTERPQEAFKTLSDEFVESLAAVSKQGMPSFELSTLCDETSPLHWIGVGRYKQLIQAMQDLLVRHRRLRETVAHALAMKRHEFTPPRQVKVAAAVRA